MELKRFQLWALGTDLAVACKTRQMLEDAKAWREGRALEDPRFIALVHGNISIQAQLRSGIAMRPAQRPLYIPDAVFFDSFLKTIWEKSDAPAAKWLALNRMLFMKSSEENRFRLPAWYEGPVYHDAKDLRGREGDLDEQEAPQQTS